MGTLTLRPEAAGDLTQIASQYPAEGEHWDKVDEESPDDAGSYVNNSAPGANQTDLYNLEDVSQEGVINSVTVYARFYWPTNFQPGTDIAIVTKTEGMPFYDTPPSKTAYWHTYSKTYPTNPFSGQPWTWAQINALQAGGRLKQDASVGVTLRLTQVYVEVNWVVVAPTVTTQAATNAEETTATGNGNITSIGGQDCDLRGFEWGLASGSYPNSVTEGALGNYQYGTGAYSLSLTSLPQGTLIYYRAKAHNSAGWAYGGEQTFLTKPEAPTALDAVTATSTQIDLSWTKGTGAGKTMVRRKVGSYPTSRTDGDQAYFDTGSGFSDTSLTPGTMYYYRAWSEASGDALESWSDSYSEDYDLTKPAAPTGFTATVVWSTAIDLAWTKGTGADKTMVRSKVGSYPADRTDGDQIYYGTGESYSDTGLTKGLTYYYRAWSEVTADALEQWSDNYGQDYATPDVTAPACHTRRAVALTGTEALLAGDVVNDGLEECDVRFEWGSSYGNYTEWQSGKVTGDIITEEITGLTEDEVCHFRMEIKNSHSTTQGADNHFLSAELSKTIAVLGLACLGTFALGRKGERKILEAVRQVSPSRSKSAIRTLPAARVLRDGRWV